MQPPGGNNVGLSSLKEVVELNPASSHSVKEQEMKGLG